MYIVGHSGTAGVLCLSCPVGLPGAYDVNCGAQWDCRGLMIYYVRPSLTTSSL